MLVEVFVAILITSVFVAVAMQAMVLAAFFKAGAQKYAEATTWIQSDLENVKYKAANFPLPNTSLTANANAGVSSINVASVDGFAVNDKLKVGSDTGTYTINAISGNALTITPTLGTAQSQNAVVVAIISSSLTANANAGVSSINVASGSYFAINDKLKVGSDPNTYTISAISGNALTITPNLGTAESQAAVVLTTTRCSAHAVVAKFADSLRDKTTGKNQTVNPETIKLTKQTFNLTRNTRFQYTLLSGNANAGNSSINVTSGDNFAVNDKLQVGSDSGTYTIKAISGNVLTITPNLGTAQSQAALVVAPPPYNAVQISYDVSPPSGGSSVAKLSTEVIPNAALQCR